MKRPTPPESIVPASSRPSRVGDDRGPIIDPVCNVKTTREQAMKALYGQGWSVDALARLYGLPVAEVIALVNHRIKLGNGQQAGGMPPTSPPPGC